MSVISEDFKHPNCKSTVVTIGTITFTYVLYLILEIKHISSEVQYEIHCELKNQRKHVTNLRSNKPMYLENTKT